MPAPLAIPSSFTVAFSDRNSAPANFGRVSVVMMAWAKSEIPRGVASLAATSAGNREIMLSTGKGTPIMPVEEGNTWDADTLSKSPSARQTCWLALMPGFPVAQFALPEFTIKARTRPRLAANEARPTTRGAATTWFFVNNAAAVVAGQASTSAKSARPLALRPARAAEKLNPPGTQILLAGKPRAFILRSSPANLSAEEESRTWVAGRAPLR